jgi:dephospho-CoA kinase
MLTIGLTGGIGCGKTTVAQYFQTLGITVIDADTIARELVAPNTPAYTAIFHHFGNDILLDSGELDRKKLRTIIFADAEQRKWLEQLLHPLILQEIYQRKKAVTAPYCVLMIPLLLEKNVYHDIDRILVIDADQDLQIARVQQRDQLSLEQINAILATQLAQQERLKLADDVIVNNDKLSRLHKQIEQLHQRYLHLAQLKSLNADKA